MGDGGRMGVVTAALVQRRIVLGGVTRGGSLEVARERLAGELEALEAAQRKSTIGEVGPGGLRTGAFWRPLLCAPLTSYFTLDLSFVRRHFSSLLSPLRLYRLIC